MTQAGEQALHPAFQEDLYLFRRKVFKLFGGAFHVYDEQGRVVLYSKQKAFRLKEDFRVYADERQLDELLVIRTPQILDLGATYHVEDATRGEQIGALRRKALKSILYDSWVYLGPDGEELGRLEETSFLGAIGSRLINLIPQKYRAVTGDERRVARLNQHFNPFVLKYTMRIEDPDPSIDRRLLIASGILLAAIERRQQ